jgi:hypothetical protein
MKYLAAAVSALAWTALQAAPTMPSRPSEPPPPDLRQALQQYHPGTSAPLRQLTSAERAELRRQLTEFAQPAQRAQARRR